MSENYHSRESMPHSPLKKRYQKTTVKPLEKKRSLIPVEFVTYMKSAFFSLSEEIDLYFIKQKWHKHIQTNEIQGK